MPLTALQASAYLHHLHLHSPDPERLATFYAHAMAMRPQRSDAGWRVEGPSRRMLISGGRAKHLAHAAFAVRSQQDLAGVRAHASNNGLAPKDVQSRYLLRAHSVWSTQTAT